MKRRRSGGLDHVLNPELDLLHHPCHQANHPHTKILYIQLVSLLWRAGNPARNAPGTVSFTVLLQCCCLWTDTCQGVCDQSRGLRSSVCVQCVLIKSKSHWERSTTCISLMNMLDLFCFVQ